MPSQNMRYKIGIIGLGYVGLPLARLFSTKFPVVGFDIDSARISSLRQAVDVTLEISQSMLEDVLRDYNPPFGEKGLFCSHKISDLQDCNVFIITVPTPVDVNNRPVLQPLVDASQTVGQILKKGNIVIYESTVYPGATEEECVPILEKNSGLKYNHEFFVGYSPERINPGDKEHTVDKILKVTSGSTPEIGKIVNDLYRTVITAGTHLAPSIKVAEAAKVIENSQRDINIAFVNELAKIFNLLKIDTHAVLEAAGTKWNFLPFKPGLVGGHCIGVDPYYLAQKAQEVGYHPEIILAGRRLNDSMSAYVAAEIIKTMIKNEITINHAQILVLGVTFKENCPDFRNTKVVDLIYALKDYGVSVDIYDPWINREKFNQEYQLLTSQDLPKKTYDAVVLAVAHESFNQLDLSLLKKEVGIIYDIKGVLKHSNARL